MMMYFWSRFTMQPLFTSSASETCIFLHVGLLNVHKFTSTFYGEWCKYHVFMHAYRYCMDKITVFINYQTWTNDYQPSSTICFHHQPIPAIIHSPQLPIYGYNLYSWQHDPLWLSSHHNPILSGTNHHDPPPSTTATTVAHHQQLSSQRHTRLCSEGRSTRRISESAWPWWKRGGTTMAMAPWRHEGYGLTIVTMVQFIISKRTM